MEVDELIPDPVQVPAHLLLARHQADVLQRPAELAGLLEQGDQVAPLRRDPGRLHPGRPAADHGDPDRCRRPGHPVVGRVAAGGVDGAGDLLLGHERFLPAAAEARDAAADLADPSVLRLDRPVRIGEELAGEPDEVGLALGQDLLAVVGIAQRVAGDDRDPDDLLDRLGGVGGPALGILHRVEPGARALLHAHRQVDRGAAGPLEHAGDLDPLLEPATALAPLVERVADEEREAPAALLLDGIDHGEREAHPVLEAATEAVGAHVEERAHELGQQVAVRRVELDGVETGLLDPPGRLAEQVDELEDLGDRRLADLLALLLGVLVDDLVTGRPRQLEDAVRRAQRVVAGDRALPSGMLELDGAGRTVAVHALGQAGQAGDVVVPVGDQAGHGRPAGRHVGRRGPDDDEAGAAPGDLAVVVEIALADLTVGVRRADVRGDVDDPVRQGQVPQLDRAEEVRVRRHDALRWLAAKEADSHRIVRLDGARRKGHMARRGRSARLPARRTVAGTRPARVAFRRFRRDGVVYHNR